MRFLFTVPFEKLSETKILILNINILKVQIQHLERNLFLRRCFVFQGALTLGRLLRDRLFARDFKKRKLRSNTNLRYK